jgi:hypothetical protein
MATWCSPTAARRKARLQAPSRSREDHPWAHPRTVRRRDAEAAPKPTRIPWSLAQTASRPRRQPRRTVSLAGAVSIRVRDVARMEPPGPAGACHRAGPMINLSVIRGQPIPDYAALHPGYVSVLPLSSTTPAMMTAPMGTTAGEGGLAERTEAAPVFCEACLGLRHVRDRVATEPESIVRAGLAGCLGRCRANIRGHRAGQQSEHRDCRESNTSGFNISHLAQSSYGPSVTLARERGPL